MTDFSIISVFLAFFVLINPFGALGLFINLTKNNNRKQRLKTAQIACFSAFVAIVFCAVAGELLLKTFGITIGSFRIAGGILVFLIALNMMNGDGNPVKPHNEDDPDISDDLVNSTTMSTAVVPIAIPMIVGPGGISTVIIYSAAAQGYQQLGLIIFTGLIVCVFCYIILAAAGSVVRFLGETGLNIMSRVLGMLLAAVAVEIILAGLRDIVPNIFL